MTRQRPTILPEWEHDLQSLPPWTVDYGEYTENCRQLYAAHGPAIADLIKYADYMANIAAKKYVRKERDRGAHPWHMFTFAERARAGNRALRGD